MAPSGPIPTSWAKSSALMEVQYMPGPQAQPYDDTHALLDYKPDLGIHKNNLFPILFGMSPSL